MIVYSFDAISREEISIEEMKNIYTHNFIYEMNKVFGISFAYTWVLKVIVSRSMKTVNTRKLIPRHVCTVHLRKSNKLKLEIYD